MLHAPLDRCQNLPGIAFEPAAVEVFGDHAELDNEVAGEVLGLDFAPRFTPEADDGSLVVAQDDPRVRAADERAASGLGCADFLNPDQAF